MLIHPPIHRRPLAIISSNSKGMVPIYAIWGNTQKVILIDRRSKGSIRLILVPLHHVKILGLTKFWKFLKEIHVFITNSDKNFIRGKSSFGDFNWLKYFIIKISTD